MSRWDVTSVPNSMSRFRRSSRLVGRTSCVGLVVYHPNSLGTCAVLTREKLAGTDQTAYLNWDIENRTLVTSPWDATLGILASISSAFLEMYARFCPCGQHSANRHARAQLTKSSRQTSQQDGTNPS
jgi:hypothetical protein